MSTGFYALLSWSIWIIYGSQILFKIWSGTKVAVQWISQTDPSSRNVSKVSGRLFESCGRKFDRNLCIPLRQVSMYFVLSFSWPLKSKLTLRPMLEIRCNFTWVKGIHTMNIEQARLFQCTTEEKICMNCCCVTFPTFDLHAHAHNIYIYRWNCIIKACLIIDSSRYFPMDSWIANIIQHFARQQSVRGATAAQRRLSGLYMLCFTVYACSFAWGQIDFWL